MITTTVTSLRKQVSRWPIARQLLVLQVVLTVLVLAGAAVMEGVVVQRREQVAARTLVVDVAQSVAVNPFVVQEMTTADPTLRLQPYTEAVRRRTATSFVEVLSTDGQRYTHPNPALIGGRFQGTTAPAVRGRTVVETFTGTLGPSVRAVVPVRGSSGRVIALVAVGVTTDVLHEALLRQLVVPFVVLVVLLGVAVAGSALVAARLRRQTHGLDAEAMHRLNSSYEAVLHSVREGLAVVDPDGRVAVLNDEARELLALTDVPVGTPVVELPIASSLREVLSAASRTSDQTHVHAGRLLLVSSAPVAWDAGRRAVVMTLRDRTELEALMGELDTTRALAEALHAQAHESANRLHTIVVLLETGRSEDAVAYATGELELSQRLTDEVVASVEEPVLAAMVLGKVAQGAERGVLVRVRDDSALPAGLLPSRDLVTIVGNLVDNALDAAASARPADGRPATVTVGVRREDPDGDVVLTVEDTGPGLAPELLALAFTRGWSTKPVTTVGGRGLGLALVDAVVRRHGGVVDVRAGEGGGTVVCVRLPVERPAEVAVP